MENTNNIMSAQKAYSKSNEQWSDQIKAVNEEISKAAENGDYEVEIPYQKIFGKTCPCLNKVTEKYSYPKYRRFAKLIEEGGYEVSWSQDYMYISW